MLVMAESDYLKPKIIHYLHATWYARWVIIAIVLASYQFLPSVNELVVSGLACLAIAYNLVLWFGTKAGLTFLSNRLFLEITDSIFSLLLIINSGGIHSTYTIILALILVSCGYWYGARAAAILGTLQAMALIGYTWITAQSFVQLRTYVVQTAILLSLGVYVSWLTMSERSERHELTDLGAEAEQERQQLLALVNNMPEAVLVVNPRGMVSLYNQAAVTMLGAAIAQHATQDNLVFLDKDRRPVDLRFKDYSQPEERNDLLLQLPDSSYVHIQLSIAPYIIDRQERGHIVIIRDISGDKTVSEERQEFIAVASHELRTPLTIAQGNLSLLMAPDMAPNNPQAVHLLESASRSLQQLSNIIKDLTNLDQVDSRQLEVSVESIDPVAVLRELETDYRNQVAAKELLLQVDIAEDMQLSTILSSGYLVRQILTIFVTNAIKFTEHGTITLGLQDHPDHPGGITFFVQDTGSGIAQAEQKKIFEKFFQSEDFMTRSHGGTGLGLFIAKKLASRLTGEVWFDSKLGQGSTFYLWIPPYSRDKADRQKVASAETTDLFSSI